MEEKPKLFHRCPPQPTPSTPPLVPHFLRSLFPPSGPSSLIRFAEPVTMAPAATYIIRRPHRITLLATIVASLHCSSMAFVSLSKHTFTGVLPRRVLLPRIYGSNKNGCPPDLPSKPADAKATTAKTPTLTTTTTTTTTTTITTTTTTTTRASRARAANSQHGATETGPEANHDIVDGFL